MILQTNGKQKKAGAAMLISDKADFKTKKTMRDEEGHYIIIKRTFRQEDITFMNIYTPNTGAPKYIKQLLTRPKEEVHNNTLIVRDLNTPFISMDRSSRQKDNKKIVVLNEILGQIN